MGRVGVEEYGGRVFIDHSLHDLNTHVVDSTTTPSTPPPSPPPPPPPPIQPHSSPDCIHDSFTNSLPPLHSVGVQDTPSSTLPFHSLTIHDISPIEAARARFLQIIVNHFIDDHLIEVTETDHDFISHSGQDKFTKRKIKEMHYEGDPKFALPLMYVANLYETLVNDANIRLSSFTPLRDKTIGVALEAAGGLYRRLAQKFPKKGPCTFKRRELATSLETRTRFPELVIQEEKRVRFVVVNGLDIVEKPNTMPLEDAEWFKRLTGRSEVAVSAQDYKFYSPRHKYRRVAASSVSSISSLNTFSSSDNSSTLGTGQGFRSLSEQTPCKHHMQQVPHQAQFQTMQQNHHQSMHQNQHTDRDTCSRLASSCVRARKFTIVKILLEVFESHTDVAASAFEAAMGAYNKLHMFKSTIQVFQHLKSAKIEADSGCYYRVMEAYLKIGDSQKVMELFNELESRISDLTPFSTKIFGILCESLAKSGRVFESLEFFRDMRKKGIAEDYTIYSSLICTFASIREVKLAEDLFEEAKSKKLLRDPAIFLKLILMYIQQGSLEKALEIVRVMKNLKIGVSDCIFCAVVNGYAQRRGYKAAVKVYEELISEGCDPGQVTYASAINAYSRLGFYSKAEDIFSEMEQRGFDKCVVAYSSLITMYGKTGRLKDAMRLLAKMKERGCQPNVWIYNILMEMHGKAKNLKQVEKLWKEMKRRKIVPDKVSYTTIISAYTKAGEFEMCDSYYLEFRMNGGVVDKAMAGIMVGVFSKTSRVDELVKLLKDMKSEGTPLDGRLYKSASNALMDAGLQLQAKWLQDHYAVKSGSG